MAKFSKELSQAEHPESKAAFEKLTLAFGEMLQRLFSFPERVIWISFYSPTLDWIESASTDVSSLMKIAVIFMVWGFFGSLC